MLGKLTYCRRVSDGESIFEGLCLSYTEQEIQAVWEKGETVPSNSSDVYRKDACGAWIARNHYGNRQSQYGWEIDHIDPDGGEELSNLRPLHWLNNAHRQDDPLTCAVTSSGTTNVNASS